MGSLSGLQCERGYFGRPTYMRQMSPDEDGFHGAHPDWETGKAH